MSDDLVAGREQRHRRVEERLFPAGRDDHLRLVVHDAIVGAVSIADRPLHVRRAADGRVFREAPIDGLVPGDPDVIRREKIGLSGAQVDELDALAPQTVDSRRDGHGS
jgi:hypothetical protein